MQAFLKNLAVPVVLLLAACEPPPACPTIPVDTEVERGVTPAPSTTVVRSPFRGQRGRYWSEWHERHVSISGRCRVHIPVWGYSMQETEEIRADYGRRICSGELPLRGHERISRGRHVSWAPEGEHIDHVPD